MKRPVEKNIHISESYERTQMQKEMIIQKLKDKGGRLTRQRLILLDIILETECSTCKEIYYKAVNRNEKISLSTVYRLVSILEEIGAISRKNMYKIICSEYPESEDAFTLEFDDGTTTHISAESWDQIVCAGLEEYGYMQGRRLRNVRRNTPAADQK